VVHVARLSGSTQTTLGSALGWSSGSGSVDQDVFTGYKI
jgi:hypothetical protein